MKLIIAILSGSLLLWAAVAVPSYAESSSAIKIGALLVLSGDLAAQNAAFRDGIDLATAQVNASGGINGHPVEVVYEDTRGNPKTANSAAKKLLSIDHVRAVILASVIEAKGAGYDLVKAKVPALTLWDASEDIQKIGNYVFSIGLWTPSTGETAGRFARQNLGALTAVVFGAEDEWSIGAGDYFSKVFEAGGGKVLKRFTFNPDELDYRAAPNTVKALKPDVIYSTITLAFVPFFKQLRALRMETPIITSDILNDYHLSSDPALFERVYQTQATVPDSAATKKMVADFKQHFGRSCDQVQYVALGYDALNLLAKALAIGGDDASKVRDAIASTKAYPGASGEITFDAQGSAAKIAAVFQIKSAKFVPLGADAHS